MPFDDCCVFVSSSDNTWDIFRQVSRTFQRYWPDCPFEKYVGCNGPKQPVDLSGFLVVTAPVTEWRSELRAQIAALPERVRFVSLFLDDFFLYGSVNSARLATLVAEARAKNLGYLRLVPEKRSVAEAMAHIALTLGRNGEIEPVSRLSPYYSALHAVIWRREHLLRSLEQPGSIWEFELTRLDEQHFVVTGDAAIEYVHVVERGKWMPYAARLFALAGLSFEPGKREVTGTRYRIHNWIKRLRFAIVGYSWYRLRLEIRKAVKGA